MPRSTPVNTPRPKKATLEFIALYNPAKGNQAVVTPAEWSVVSEFVRGTVAPLAWMTANSLRPYLTAMTRLAKWTVARGLPLDTSYVLSPDLLEAFAVSQEFGVASVASYLARLGSANGVAIVANNLNVGVPRPEYKLPYSDEELAALVLFIRAHRNKNRRATMMSIVALGVGAGVVRSRLRGVSASSVHVHEGLGTFVRTSENCAKVREECIELLTEACTLRPRGKLLGGLSGADLTSVAAQWVTGHVGVPTLSTDRLRATYVVALLNEGHELRQLMAWTGLQTAEALDNYLPMLEPLGDDCAHPKPKAQ
jgi:hypothetical protein